MMRLVKGTGIIAVLLGMTAFANAAEETSGTIKTVDANRREVIVKGVVKDTVYELNKDATVWLDGARAKLTDLKADDRVVIVYDKKGDHLMAAQVRSLRNTQEARGTVSDVITDKKEVVLKGTVKNTTYEMDKNCTVWIDGKTSSLKSVRAGDDVIITYQRRGDHMIAHDVTVTKHR
jgi:Cu/Ag efflux protein CusF